MLATGRCAHKNLQEQKALDEERAEYAAEVAKRMESKDYKLTANTRS